MARKHQKPDRKGDGRNPTVREVQSRAMYSTSSEARQSIIQSIRSHLAESARIELLHERTPALSENQSAAYSEHGDDPNVFASPVAMFGERLEGVGGHCVVAKDKAEAARALTQLVSALQSSIAAKRIPL